MKSIGVSFLIHKFLGWGPAFGREHLDNSHKSGVELNSTAIKSGNGSPDFPQYVGITKNNETQQALNWLRKQSNRI